MEHPSYVPLLRRALKLWKGLSERDLIARAKESGGSASGLEPLLRMTGALMIGPASDLETGSGPIGGTMASIKEHKLEHEVLSPEDVRHRYPAFRMAQNEIALFEKDAALLVPERCVSAHLREAEETGNATLHFNEGMASWEAVDDAALSAVSSAKGAADEGGGGQFVVRSVAGNEFRANKLVLSVGAWAGKEFGAPLKARGVELSVERRVLHWFKPTAQDQGASTAAAGADGDAQALFNDIPVYMWAPRVDVPQDVEVYGFPLQDPSEGAKVAVHGGLGGLGLQLPTPEELRTRPEVEQHEIDEIQAMLRAKLPELGFGQHLKSASCMYTFTPNEHFFIDWHPDHAPGQVLLVSPCSGHGFKFSSVVGEACAALLAVCPAGGGKDELEAAAAEQGLGLFSLKEHVAGTLRSVHSS